MKRIYGKTIRELIIELVDEKKIIGKTTITKDEIVAWFTKKYPLIRKNTLNCQITLHTTNAPSRVHFGAKKDNDIFIQLSKYIFRKYDPSIDPTPIYVNTVIPPVTVIPPSGGKSAEGEETEFAYEKDLQQYLARNLSIIEKGLALYKDEESGANGIEFPAGDRFIDLLAIDSNNNYVVIELKVSKGYDRVVGQVLRYVSWVKMNLAENEQTVRGVIVAREISDDIKLATMDLEHIQLYEYELKVNLKSIEKAIEQ